MQTELRVRAALMAYKQAKATFVEQGKMAAAANVCNVIDALAWVLKDDTAYGCQVGRLYLESMLRHDISTISQLSKE